jgi:PilZ domain
MNAPKSFGKLGNRKMARLATGLDAGIVLPERRVQCRVENASRTGCCLHLEEPPRVGTTALVRIEAIEALGTVAWVKGNRCGITFDGPLPIEAVERIRWIVEHAREHEAAALAKATAVWR